jgi:hypothetical protein
MKRFRGNRISSYKSKILFLEYSTSWKYDLYAAFNMGKFRLDRISTKHIVNINNVYFGFSSLFFLRPPFVRQLLDAKLLFTSKLHHKAACPLKRKELAERRNGEILTNRIA